MNEKLKTTVEQNNLEYIAQLENKLDETITAIGKFRHCIGDLDEFTQPFYSFMKELESVEQVDQQTFEELYQVIDGQVQNATNLLYMHTQARKVAQEVIDLTKKLDDKYKLVIDAYTPKIRELKRQANSVHC